MKQNFNKKQKLDLDPSLVFKNHIRRMQGDTSVQEGDDEEETFFKPLNATYHVHDFLFYKNDAEGNVIEKCRECKELKEVELL